VSSTATPAPAQIDKPWRKFSAWERVQLWLITWTAYLIIRLLGPTIRFAV